LSLRLIAIMALMNGIISVEAATTTTTTTTTTTKLRSRKKQPSSQQEQQEDDKSSRTGGVGGGGGSIHNLMNGEFTSSCSHYHYYYYYYGYTTHKCHRLWRLCVQNPSKSLRNLIIVVVAAMILLVLLSQTFLLDDHHADASASGPCLAKQQPLEWIHNQQQQQRQYYDDDRATATATATTNSADGSSDYYRQGRRRLLIAQYINSQDSLLGQVISRINRAYASKWQQDYVLLLLNDKSSNNCHLRQQHRRSLLHLAYYDDDDDDHHAKNRRRTNNKKNHNTTTKTARRYDQILTLDGNSVIFDFDRDITGLMPYYNDHDHDHEMIESASASSALLPTLLRWWRWESSSKPSTTLWNVKYLLRPMMPGDDELEGDDDTSTTTTSSFVLRRWGATLYDTLFRKKTRALRLSHNEFGGPSATVVRTLQPHKEDWTSMDDTIGHICLSEPSICNNNNNNNNNNHNTNNNNATGGGLRPPRWDWRYYSKNKNNLASPRVLLAQYSAFGTYAKLLELTAPLNKAYAKQFHYDYVALQGSTLQLPRDAWYPPPEERSRFNKIALLQTAVARGYDRVLLLDADAMVYDFSKDIVTEYLPQKNDYLLAAHRVEESDGRHAWNINNGVTVWNLRHPNAVEVMDGWEERARLFLQTNPTTRSYMLRGDQSFLHGVLKRGNLRNVVYSYSQEFQYRNATVVKHFIREGLDWKKDDVWKRTSLDSRSENIEKARREVCDKYVELSCQDLETTVYTD
jgi:hypothetical protein